MDFLAFEALVDLLTPFLCPITATFVRPPIPVRKQVKNMEHCERNNGIEAIDKN